MAKTWAIGRFATVSLCLALAACTRAAGDANGAAVPAQIATERSLAVAAGSGLELPAPGSYVLDHILPAPSALVLDSDRASHPLRRYTTGQITVFSFIYTACSDARGCPLALATLHLLKAAIARDPRLREQVRFVSMSFDPEYDTPPVMRSYGGADARPDARPRWHFLTAASPAQLAPLTAGFDQRIVASSASSAVDGGNATGAASRPQLVHLLKIYLIDRDGDVREIYSPAFLQPAAMLADIRSLLAEPQALAAGK